MQETKNKPGQAPLPARGGCEDEWARQQALSSEIGRTLNAKASLPASLQKCAEAIAQHLDAAFARIWTLDEAGDTLELQASAGLYTHLDGPHSRIPVGQFKIGLIAAERKPHLTNFVIGDPRVSDQDWARREGMIAFAGHPLIVASQVVGFMAVFARRPLPQTLLNTLESIAGQIASGIEWQQAGRRLREQTEVIATIHRVAQAVSAELDLQKLVQTCTDAATELTGAQFGAFFYNVKDDLGESHTLYTISGVPRERFSQFAIPRNTAIFAPTFAGEKTLRLNDVTQDPRYGKNGPYQGMPEGHLPVKSYLAVAVVSRSGEVVGGLFFGHAQAGVFTERHESIVEGLAAQTAIALDNARLYQKEKERSEQLAQVIQEMHHRVKNSLQGVSALLEMQIPPDSDMMPTATARESLNQIKTIALVYDLLARDQPIGKVDAGQVLTKLGLLLCAGAQTAEQNNSIQVTAEPAMIPTKAATSLALTVNELVSNSLKHSSKIKRKNADAEAAIRIRLWKQNEAVHVSVQDAGPGFPSDFDPKIHANIGLELVLTLVRHDLRGTIVFSNRLAPDAGTICGGQVEIVFSENVFSE